MLLCCCAAVLLCSCGHGGHTVHLAEWFEQESECPTGCGCACVMIAVAASKSVDGVMDDEITSAAPITSPSLMAIAPYNETASAEGSPLLGNRRPVPGKGKQGSSPMMAGGAGACEV